MMPPRYPKLRALIARVSRLLRPPTRAASPLKTHDFHRACKELAFWSASDAALSGPIEGFDGSALHPAADGLYIIRMTLSDSLTARSPVDAANLVLRSLEGLRILLLLEVDGRRFVQVARDVNAGVREICDDFTSRRESTG